MIHVFKVIKTSRDYVIIRDGGTYDQHGHIRNRRTVNQLIRYIELGKLPTSRYLRECARRLLTDEEYNNLQDKRKDYYINVNKGVRP